MLRFEAAPHEPVRALSRPSALPSHHLAPLSWCHAVPSATISSVIPFHRPYLSRFNRGSRRVGVWGDHLSSGSAELHPPFLDHETSNLPQGTTCSTYLLTGSQASTPNPSHLPFPDQSTSSRIPPCIPGHFCFTTLQMPPIQTQKNESFLDCKSLEARNQDHAFLCSTQ